VLRPFVLAPHELCRDKEQRNGKYSKTFKQRHMDSNPSIQKTTIKQHRLTDLDLFATASLLAVPLLPPRGFVAAERPVTRLRWLSARDLRLLRPSVPCAAPLLPALLEGRPRTNTSTYVHRDVHTHTYTHTHARARYKAVCCMQPCACWLMPSRVCATACAGAPLVPC